jgi:hypothetical protein
VAGPLAPVVWENAGIARIPIKTIVVTIAKCHFMNTLPAHPPERGGMAHTVNKLSRNGPDDGGDGLRKWNVKIAKARSTLGATETPRLLGWGETLPPGPIVRRS